MARSNPLTHRTKVSTGEQRALHEEREILVDESAQVLSTFKLGRDIGVISVSTYSGKRALDLRRFYQNEEEQWCPTAKGIRIPIEEAPAVIEALIDHLRAGDVR